MPPNVREQLEAHLGDGYRDRYKRLAEDR
jgi:hypothetical protein